MLIALLIAAQPAVQPAPPASGAIDVTASLIAYRDWRLCLDGRLGPPPRLVRPRRKAIEAALAACSAHEESLRSALAVAFGPVQGAESFAKFASDTRAEIGLPAKIR